MTFPQCYKSVSNPDVYMQIFDKAVDDLIKANDESRLDHDAMISFSLLFIEKLLPRVLDSCKQDALTHETRRKDIATKLRVVISAVMPFDKFMEYMNLKEMRAIDGIVKALEEGGAFNFDDSKLDDLFKETKAPHGMYG